MALNTSLVTRTAVVGSLAGGRPDVSDYGRPTYDANHAGKLAALGCPVFACTPDLFPDLMAAAPRRDDIAAWAAARDIALVRASA